MFTPNASEKQISATQTHFVGDGVNTLGRIICNTRERDCNNKSDCYVFFTHCANSQDAQQAAVHSKWLTAVRGRLAEFMS